MMDVKTRNKSRANAKRRGSDYEIRTALKLQGSVHPGVDGDVKAGDYMIECKYRSGFKLKSGNEFREWLDQVTRYRKDNWKKGQKWAMALTGGRSVMNGETLIVLPMGEFLRLIRMEDDMKTMKNFRERHPDKLERAAAMIEAYAADLLEEINSDSPA